jgi:hypothetical protein
MKCKPEMIRFLNMTLAQLVLQFDDWKPSGGWMVGFGAPVISFPLRG